ncbi:aminoglycoside phosphotransferase (APT) family kinase protein [Pseudonocardia hierapolitana]|uniref:Aminoglycoside phosphotransferase (APT) family kinase protein n=1 Tax=Pseudonocardia hierapolitana TaxID=1128676 RepID=A0A561T5A9_9PSEU|nr:aminoglycoside phosphotransferase family protein [Pseudonocardia hierapolitana]TWF82293.1 aminoglycoside phosphotransferase (APT) family kinase protein [Pseudonocardia hierapolitana]
MTAGADEELITSDAVRSALAEACPGVRVGTLRRLDAGYTSRQWVADTDEGPLLVKAPVRDTDPEHLRRLIATTRRAGEGGVPVVRFRAFVPRSRALERPVLVQEYQRGTPADEAWESMDPAGRTRFAEDLGQVVGRVHSCAGPWFGDVLGTEKYPDRTSFLRALVDSRLAEAPEDLTSAGRAGLSAAIHGAIDALPADDSPSLTHGDLWRQNVILRDRRIACLLDFEHGRYADRFLDFGKLDEHVFDAFPEGRAAFLDAYGAVCPLPDDWESRVRLGHAIHALSMSVYFLRWTPKWAPQYVRELEQWLATRP